MSESVELPSRHAVVGSTRSAGRMLLQSYRDEEQNSPENEAPYESTQESSTTTGEEEKVSITSYCDEDQNSLENEAPPAVAPAVAQAYEATQESSTATGEEEKKSITLRLVEKVVTVFPKVEPLPWNEFFKISFTCAVPAAIYILLFTKMGFGLRTLLFVSEYLEQYAWNLAAALAAFIFSLYMLDFSYWDSKWGIVCRKASWGLLILGCAALVLFLSGEYPYGPICLFAVLTPMWLVLAKHLLYSNKSTRTYVSWLSGPLFFVSLLAGFLWLIWTFLRDENEWNDVTRLDDAEEAGCEPNFEEYPDCKKESSQFQLDSDEVCFEVMNSPPDIVFPEGCDENCVRIYDGCLNTFILWVGPLLASLGLFFLSFFCSFLRTEGTNERDVINFGKLWIFLLFALWVTASLAGVGSGLASALVALTLASFVGSVVFLSSSFSRPDRKAQSREAWEKVKTNYGSHLDIARGLAVIVSAPFAIIYLGLSFLNQSVRRLGIFRCSKSLREEADDTLENDVDENVAEGESTSERTDWFTKRTRKQINSFKSWDRSKVYTYAVYWGIALMTVSVIVARLTTLLLSWLIQKTSSMSLGAATAILVAVGIFLFLLPPVPGVPIYLTFGLVVVALGNYTLGYVGSMVYSVSLSLAVKLLACTLQQKLIGGSLSHYVYVRRLVGINSKLSRAMRLVLDEPGLSVAKVTILVGGPDWPTSVMCGIMKLELIPILVGTLPVILPMIPMTVGGSFIYMASLKENGTPVFPWAGVAATVSFTFASMTLFGCMLAAAYFLEQAASSREDEISAIPIDEEVKEAEDKDQHIRKAYSDVTRWDVVPRMAKFVITLSLACMVACCYIVLLFPHKCFVEYEVTYTISEHLDGNWTNLVLPLGRAAILLFVVSCAFLFCFVMWAKRKSFHITRGGRIFPENDADNGGVDS